jgi:hypothetical protein
MWLEAFAGTGVLIGSKAGGRIMVEVFEEKLAPSADIRRTYVSPPIVPFRPSGSPPPRPDTRGPMASQALVYLDRSDALGALLELRAAVLARKSSVGRTAALTFINSRIEKYQRAVGLMRQIITEPR